MQIQLVPYDSMTACRSLIPREVYERILRKEAWAIGAYTSEERGQDTEPAGVLVYSFAPDVFDNGIRELVIDSVYVEDSYRSNGVATELIRSLEKKALSMGRIRGISISIPIPELQVAADYFQHRGYLVRVEGNRIYRVPVKGLYYNSQFCHQGRI